MNVSELIALRDKLNADFNALIAAGSGTLDEQKINAVIQSGNELDAAVIAASTPIVSSLNFDAYDTAVNKLTENMKTFRAGYPKQTQAIVDSAASNIETLNAVFLAALGVQ